LAGQPGTQQCGERLLCLVGGNRETLGHGVFSITVYV
jgi:hypothetical protein